MDMNDADTMMCVSIVSLGGWLIASAKYNALFTYVAHKTPLGDALMAAGIILMVCLAGGWGLVVLRNWT